MAEIFSISNILGGLINSFAYIYIWTKLLDEKIKLKSKRYCIVQILFALSLMLNYLLVNALTRIIFVVMMMSVFCYILYKKNIQDCIITSFISQIIMMASEIIFAVFLTVILRMDANDIVQNVAGQLITNLGISLIAILISRFNFIHKIYTYFSKLFQSFSAKKTLTILIITLISINFIFVAIYYKYNLFYVLVTNTLISMFYFVICFKFFSAENKYTSITNKYNTTLNSLREYEDILDVYRVSNHENKNQLLTIRSMIINKDKNIPSYIDKIIDNKIKDDEKLMFDTNKIPAGGLRAVIYSKMLYMKENNINFNLKVNRKVRTVELIELGDDLMLDVCKIVGVFLDNAIEAVENLKDKMVNIDLSIDDDFLNIEIANNFEGNIDISELDTKGYTTKSAGHGYGLSLVKEIINKNDKLINERKVTSGVFIQKLKIKIKDQS